MGMAQSTGRAVPNSVLANGAAQVREAAVPGILFLGYCYFIIDFYLHLPQRIPGYGVIRPTLLEAALISAGLLLNADVLKRANQLAITRVLWVLVAYIFLSLPLVEWPGSVVRENLAVFVKAVVFFFFTAYIVDTQWRLMTVLFLWMGLQVFRVLEPLGLYLATGRLGGHTHLGGGEFAGRLNGAPADVINANELGFVIATLLPVMHFMLFWSRSAVLRLGYLALLGPLLYALVLTASRGGFIAVCVGLAYIVAVSRRKAVWIALILVGGLIGFGSLSDFQRDRYLSIFVDTGSVSTVSAEGRVQGMLSELRLGLNRPIVGHGLGTTPEAKWNVFGNSTQASHILYAEVLIEIGVIGACIFFAFLYQVFRTCRENLRRMRAEGGMLLDERDVLVRLNHALLCSFIVYAVYSLNYWGLSQPYWYFLGGLSVAFARIAEQRFRAMGTGSTEAVSPDGAGKAKTGSGRPSVLDQIRGRA